MLRRREATLDWMSDQVYRVLPLSGELHQMKELFPDETIMKIVRPYYATHMGRGSEDPVLLTKIMLLSFFYAVEGDDNTLETLTYRMDWRQLCDLPLDAPISDRTTLVTCRRRGGVSVIEGIVEKCVAGVVKRGLVDLNHRFFDGTPVKARASLNPYRDDVYTELLAALDKTLQEFHDQPVERDSSLHTTPVTFKTTTYSSENAAVNARRSQEMKPVAERHSAGDPEARFQRGKHGKRSELGDDVFFSTDGKPVFIEDVQVSAEASHGQQLFLDTLEQSKQGQRGSGDAECAEGDILAKAEEKEVHVNTPPRQVPSHGTFSNTECRYDAEADTYTCPHGQVVSHRGTNRKLDDRHDRPERGTCDTCPLRESCTTSKTGRTITRNRHEAEWERQREHCRTPEAVMGKVLRGIIAEGTFAEAVRHGLKKMRYVGKEMALMQSTLVAFMLNIKRFLRLEAQGVMT